jgi:hypothetical protein
MRSTDFIIHIFISQVLHLLVGLVFNFPLFGLVVSVPDVPGEKFFLLLFFIHLISKIHANSGLTRSVSTMMAMAMCPSSRLAFPSKFEKVFIIKIFIIFISLAR